MIPSRGASIGKGAIKKGYGLDDVKFFEGLEKDFVDFRFKMGDKFAFRPPKTVVLGPPEPFSKLLALHEVSHALLGHISFKTDVERLKMETAAWQKAQKLADSYSVRVDEDFMQEELDSYRDWLHQKSRCPKCGLTRFQAPDGHYDCPRCSEI